MRSFTNCFRIAQSYAMNLEKINVLLEDDDQDDRNFFDEALKQLPISSCLTTVNDGERLMAKLSDETLELPHVIFLDINMPRKIRRGMFIRNKATGKAERPSCPVKTSHSPRTAYCNRQNIF